MSKGLGKTCSVSRLQDEFIFLGFVGDKRMETVPITAQAATLFLQRCGSEQARVRRPRLQETKAFLQGLSGLSLQKPAADCHHTPDGS
jgi:hypothetical protein